MESKIIYIAGPISDDPEYFEKFAAAQRYLERIGWQVLNPALMFRTIKNAPYWRIINLCLSIVRQADAIALLPNWQLSNGAQKELDCYRHSRPMQTVVILETQKTEAGWTAGLASRDLL